MKKITLIIAFILFCSLSALAQNSTPKAEVFAGYSRVGELKLNGFNTSVTGNINQYFGVTGEVSGLYTNRFGSLYTFTAGPRLAGHLGNFTLFTHSLFGGAASPGGDAAFAAVFGGGVDLKLNDRFSVRAIQVDNLLTRFSGQTQNNRRLTFGVIFNFGNK